MDAQNESHRCVIAPSQESKRRCAECARKLAGPELVEARKQGQRAAEQKNAQARQEALEQQRRAEAERLNRQLADSRLGYGGCSFTEKLRELNYKDSIPPVPVQTQADDDTPFDEPREDPIRPRTPPRYNSFRPRSRFGVLSLLASAMFGGVAMAMGPEDLKEPKKNDK